jgi:hypothetical protein
MNATVTAAAIGVGGSVIVALAAFWANVRNTNKAAKVTEQGQVTDRYTRAIEQIGSDKSLPVRIGGIYALERIARDSPRDHPTVMEVLAAFIREHSGERWQRAEAAAAPPSQATPPDVQAAVTVIGRRNPAHDSQPVDLQRAKLSGADLRGANLAGANLGGADLTGADLRGANLPDAILYSADLTGAYLSTADLTRANLTEAKLAGAILYGAGLTAARLTGADLTRANLTDANLTLADLTGADLTRANLTEAKLAGGFPVPEGWVRDPGSGRLERADEDADAAGN